MEINKQAILCLNTEEKRQLAFDLLDSIDEEYKEMPLPEWKKQLISQRIKIDKNNFDSAILWSELRKKYIGS